MNGMWRRGGRKRERRWWVVLVARDCGELAREALCRFTRKDSAMKVKDRTSSLCNVKERDLECGNVFRGSDDGLIVGPFAHIRGSMRPSYPGLAVTSAKKRAGTLEIRGRKRLYFNVLSK